MRQYETFELTFLGEEPEGSHAQVDLLMMETVKESSGFRACISGMRTANGTVPSAPPFMRWSIRKRN